jgi:hypothetical protein
MEGRIMSLTSLLFHRPGKPRRPTRPPQRFPRRRFVPRLEPLEDRTVPSTLTVTSAADNGAAGTLRSVIASAQSNDTIDFDPSLDGKTIKLSSARGQLSIAKNLDIEGPGAGLLAISGGGAVRVFAVGSGVTLTLGGLTIENGFADQGGGIDNLGSLTLSYDVLSGNQAVGDTNTSGIGGGVFNEAGANLSVTHCTFANNQSVGGVGRGWGGGIVNEGSASVTASTFTANVSTGGSLPQQPDLTAGVGFGGAIASIFSSSSLTVNNTTFTGNQAIDGLGQNAGGGALASALGSSLTVSNSTFTANQAVANTHNALGGAIRGGLDAAFSVVNCTFTGNRAVGFTQAAGGAISNEGEAGSVTNSTFRGNQALGSGPGALTFGGAIENSLVSSNFIPSLTLTNCTLTGNESLGGAGGDGVNTFGFAQGGAIDSSGNVTIQNSTLTNNLVVGGAMAPGAPASATATSVGGGLSMDQPATLIVANSTFAGNTVVGGAGTGSGGHSGPGIAAIGGAIEDFSGGSATITNSKFINNTAVGGAGGSGQPGGDGIGGGIDISYNTTATISGTTFSGNQALGGAGANAAVSDAANGSSGAGIGGAISLGTGFLFATPDTSSLVLSGCTLTGNVAQGGVDVGRKSDGGDGLGGGLAVLAGSAAVSHCTLDSNSALGGAGGSGGHGGNAFGGGIYNAGALTVSDAAFCDNNPDDIFGPYTNGGGNTFC